MSEVFDVVPAVRGSVVRRVRRGLALGMGVAAAGLLGVTGLAFLATGGASGGTVSLGSTLAHGAVATVVPFNYTLTVTNGQAQTVSGVELYKVDLGNASRSDRLRVDFSWLDPQDAQKVLNNPNAWIQVGLYDYAAAASGGACPSGQTVAEDPDSSDAQVCLTPDPGATASAQLTQAHADANLLTSVAGQGAVYILAAITTPGHAPPGQQSQLDTLSFNAAVRARY